MLLVVSVEGQRDMLVERFSSDFRKDALPKVLLACSADGKPFLTEDGKLPSPNLAAFEAVRELYSRGREGTKNEESRDVIEQCETERQPRGEEAH